MKTTDNFAKAREKLKQETAHKHPNASQLTLNSGAAAESAIRYDEEQHGHCDICVFLNKHSNYCPRYGFSPRRGQVKSDCKVFKTKHRESGIYD